MLLQPTQWLNAAVLAVIGFSWGLWHGQGLASLGADVGLLSETALISGSQHA